MEQLDVTMIILRLCLLIIFVTDKTSAAAVHKNENLISGQGLYSASDNVVILTATNFKTNIYGDTRGWLVEFYNSWCGFCFRFAPTWKALASDVLSWNDIVIIAAIDCANDDNNPICREYEIMHYPMLKYFSMNARPSSLGIEIQKVDGTDGVRHNLIKTLEKEQQEGRGSTWPNLAPYRNIEITDIWKTASSNVKHFFLIFENTDSHLGKEVILDLHRISSLQIRRVTSDNEPLCVTNKVTKFPTLIALSRNESQRIINVRIPTREGVRRAISDYMIARGLKMDDESGTTMPLNPQQHENAHQTTTAATIDKSTIRKKINDHLYQLDLENALHYSIKHEIPLKKTIEGEKMEALQKYLTVLAAYFPLRHSNIYLEVIRDIIGSKSYMTGEEFSQLAKRTEEEISSVYSKPHGWIGCKGSTNSYRGYPCGLWTMFHVLTVNFALENRDNSWASLRDDPAAVLRAMHGYIKNFFGCADCAAHFMEMANKNEIFSVRTRDEAVLWLWRAHNQVNARLSGDDTEDPEHKKIQYPVTEHCPSCRYANDTWNEKEVLRYLKSKYSYNSIKYDGIINSDGIDDIVNGSKSRTRKLEHFTETKVAASSEDLNGFDISIWLVLYVMSSVIFTLVCSRELKSYRRRMWVQEEGYKKKRNHLNPLATV